MEAHRLVPFLQARQRRQPEDAARERSSSGARSGAGDGCGRSGGSLPYQRGVPIRRVRGPRRELRGRGNQLRRQDGAAQRERGAPAAPERARHVIQAGHVARLSHGGAPHLRRHGPRRAGCHPRWRVHGPPLRGRRRRVVAERGVVTPRRPGKPHDLHRDRARVRCPGGSGRGEVRRDAAPGGAGHGALGDKQRGLVLANGAVVHRVQPPAREHPGRHLRLGAPGLRLPERRARAVGVQHHPSGLRGRTAVRGRESPAPLGEQRFRHGPLRQPGARRGGRTGRRGGRRLQAHDGGDVPGLQPRAQGIHHHRQGQEELHLLTQEGVRGAVRLQPRIPVPVVRQVRLRGCRACHAGACGAEVW